jgi:hypothetical protein
MRKMNYVLLIILLFSPMTWGQEKVEAPVWNVGDKWIFTKGSIEVVGADAKSYVLIYSSDFPTAEESGIEKKIVFDRSTLNRIYTIHKGKTEKYTEDFRKMFNFPLYPKKEWQDNYFSNLFATEFIEYYEVLGWQDVEVEAGTFKTIKIERISKPFRAYLLWGQRAIFWYAPEVKNFVKCRFNFGYTGNSEWELVSFKLKR